ncbi:hypothetical protein CUJ84_pRLN1000215 (plasmid) [Rhizobium leguminosarum]|uniref:Uncharacterized protein n=1 Tax=Rhizobium leguminosarum TaxID=384 RepID=A0A2K9ZBS3_RHILE|nr:hypothetical protein CUJ84_pRLN1000215 [Rhizobium leguminosarum]
MSCSTLLVGHGRASTPSAEVVQLRLLIRPLPLHTVIDLAHEFTKPRSYDAASHNFNEVALDAEAPAE